MICAKNCEKSKFVEVTAKILLVPFFLGHGVLLQRELEYAMRAKMRLA